MSRNVRPTTRSRPKPTSTRSLRSHRSHEARHRLERMPMVATRTDCPNRITADLHLGRLPSGRVLVGRPPSPAPRSCGSSPLQRRHPHRPRLRCERVSRSARARVNSRSLLRSSGCSAVSSFCVTTPRLPLSSSEPTCARPHRGGIL
jgi:hypothetical protein